MKYVKETARSFLDDDCMTLAAALAYYTLFSLPPLLLIIISLVGMAFGRDVVEATIQAQIKGLIGPDVGTQIQTRL
jgi:membrane protein